MDKIPYLPIGSVVLLKNGSVKLMIVSRGLNVKRGGEVYFFDYSGVLFPQGLDGDKVAYFNHDAIDTVYFTGYNNEESSVMTDTMNEYLLLHPEIKRCTPEEWAKLPE